MGGFKKRERERREGDGVIREPAQSRFVGGYQNSSFI
jgi:hypothetical protein